MHQEGNKVVLDQGYELDLNVAAGQKMFRDAVFPVAAIPGALAEIQVAKQEEIASIVRRRENYGLGPDNYRNPEQTLCMSFRGVYIGMMEIDLARIATANGIELE